MDQSSDAGDGRDGDSRDGESRDGDGESRDGGSGGNRAAELLRRIPRRSHFLPPPSPRSAGRRDGQGGGGRSGVGGRERRRGGPGYEFSASFDASYVQSVHGHWMHSRTLDTPKDSPTFGVHKLRI